MTSLGVPRLQVVRSRPSSAKAARPHRDAFRPGPYYFLLFINMFAPKTAESWARPSPIMMLLSPPRRPLAYTKVFYSATLIVSILVWLFLCYRSLQDRWMLVLPTLSLPPLLPASSIPKKIWYKLGPRGLSDAARGWTDSCIQANPSYRAEFMTDESADAWVQETFAGRPDIVEAYLGLSVPILKADILRYLLLFAEGGIWSDLDVSCNGVPIDEWVPPEYKDGAGVVWAGSSTWGWGDNVLRQLASWTIMARPGSPHIWAVVEIASRRSATGRLRTTSGCRSCSSA